MKNIPKVTVDMIRNIVKKKGIDISTFQKIIPPPSDISFDEKMEMYFSIPNSKVIEIAEQQDKLNELFKGICKNPVFEC